MNDAPAPPPPVMNLRREPGRPSQNSGTFVNLLLKSRAEVPRSVSYRQDLARMSGPDSVDRGMTDDGDLLNLRQMNRLKVIEALYRHPPSSRMEVVRRAKLSRPTVTTLLD